MLQSDQNILKTLDLLTTLSHSRKSFSTGLTDEERATFIISKQLIADAGLTLFQFISAIRELSLRGYTFHHLYFDERVRKQLDAELKKPELKKELKKLESLDTQEISDKIKKGTIESLNKLAPAGQKIDVDEVDDEFIKFSDLTKQSIEAYKKLKPNELGYVWLLPFRSIERLYTKMDSGMSYDHIQDTDIWYDSTKRKLYVGSDTYSTNYRGTTSRVHFILDALFKNLDSGLTIGYEIAHEFDEVHNGYKKHYDSMRHFVKNKTKLEDIFEIYTDRVGINSKYKDDVH